MHQATPVQEPGKPGEVSSLNDVKQYLLELLSKLTTTAGLSAEDQLGLVKSVRNLLERDYSHFDRDLLAKFAVFESDLFGVITTVLTFNSDSEEAKQMQVQAVVILIHLCLAPPESGI